MKGVGRTSKKRKEKTKTKGRKKKKEKKEKKNTVRVAAMGLPGQAVKGLPRPQPCASPSQPRSQRRGGKARHTVKSLEGHTHPALAAGFHAVPETTRKTKPGSGRQPEGVTIEGIGAGGPKGKTQHMLVRVRAEGIPGRVHRNVGASVSKTRETNHIEGG